MKPIRTRLDLFTKALLAAIALFLGVLAASPLLAPRSVHAQGEPQLYIEPGHTLLRQPGGKRQVLGKVVVNLRTGDIWGFPTGVEAPYPIDPTTETPPVSKPMYLGQFDLGAMRK
jgi:hypothetical protein